jgi:hypothetical protein
MMLHPETPTQLLTGSRLRTSQTFEFLRAFEGGIAFNVKRVPRALDFAAQIAERHGRPLAAAVASVATFRALCSPVVL